jgi:hyperosmotically inducible protein
MGRIGLMTESELICQPWGIWQRQARTNIEKREETMKKTIACWGTKIKRIITILCLSIASVAAGLLVTGCAGDRYHESTGESIDDAAITIRVKSALGGDPLYKYDDVHVLTFKGTVQLSGYVGSTDSRKHAVQLTKNVEGVKDVTNGIAIKD